MRQMLYAMSEGFVVLKRQLMLLCCIPQLATAERSVPKSKLRCLTHMIAGKVYSILHTDKFAWKFFTAVMWWFRLLYKLQLCVILWSMPKFWRNLLPPCSRYKSNWGVATLYRDGSQCECRTGKALKGTLPKEEQGQVRSSAHLSYWPPLLYNLVTCSWLHFYPEDGGRRYLEKLVTTYKTTRCQKPIWKGIIFMPECSQHWYTNISLCTLVNSC